MTNKRRMMKQKKYLVTLAGCTGVERLTVAEVGDVVLRRTPIGWAIKLPVLTLEVAVMEPWLVEPVGDEEQELVGVF